jgi:hypothetical protein
MPDKIRIRPVKQIPAAFTSLSHPILPMPRFPAAVRHGKNSTPARLALSLGRGLGEGERSHHSMNKCQFPGNAPFKGFSISSRYSQVSAAQALKHRFPEK